MTIAIRARVVGGRVAATLATVRDRARSVWCRRVHRAPPRFARDASRRALWECATCGRTWPRAH